MTNPKDLLLTTLKFQTPEIIPHSNVIFDLAYEAFGIDYPGEEELAKASGKDTEARPKSNISIIGYSVITIKVPNGLCHHFRPTFVCRCVWIIISFSDYWAPSCLN